VLLQQIGDRLVGLVGPHEVIARLGGDEFAVLLPDTDEQGALRVAQRILATLDEPLSIADYPLDVGGSIGIALSPQHGDDADVLLRRADVAMYVAKRTARGVAVYSPELDQHTPERLALLGELRRAIEAGQDELRLVYQPKLCLRSGRCVGVEALIRWHHPQRGPVQPDQFIPLAEQTGLIKPLSQWVLNAALKQARAWDQLGLPSVPIAVNLAMRDLHDPELPDTVAALLQRWQIHPSRLEVEITENGLMAEPARALQTLTGLRAMGIHIAIDDFGTGYSSLAYLKRLPVDELKIDRSFVLQVAKDRHDRAIVRSTIELAHDLGLTVVAEGVEDSAAWDLLARQGCDIAQGYYLSRPLPAAAFETWLQRASSERRAA
jgi:predicted signal transduction protein with EAL and GGDEF domain